MSDGPRAVALRFDQDQEAAPRVLAKGQGPVAERIIALAHEHGIPLHEDRDLVHLLGALDLSVEVPPALYHALAEVLAHLYRANASNSSNSAKSAQPSR
jgi:flagellar biosynthesis protein